MENMIKKEQVDKVVADIFKTLEIPKNWKGYKYLKTATFLLLENEDYFVGDIYKIISKLHKTTYSKTEKVIRYICEQKQNELKKYFEVNYKIYNSKLITLTAEKVQESVLWRTA